MLCKFSIRVICSINQDPKIKNNTTHKKWNIRRQIDIETCVVFNKGEGGGGRWVSVKKSPNWSYPRSTPTGCSSRGFSTSLCCWGPDPRRCPGSTDFLQVSMFTSRLLHKCCLSFFSFLCCISLNNCKRKNWPRMLMRVDKSFFLLRAFNEIEKNRLKHRIFLIIICEAI